MTYTPFGELFRIIRLKHHEVLADASKFLGVTSAYISAVECGKRAIPEEWVDNISEHYNLNEKDKASLVQAVEDSKTVLKINLVDVSPAQREVAMAFGRSFETLDSETAQEIIEIIRRNGKSGL